MDTHLEVVVIPVSDDRAKAFYSMLGWRLDADVSRDEYRLVQFTAVGLARFASIPTR
jgi:predicted enzyme related to lactoylglutathione lyase